MELKDGIDSPTCGAAKATRKDVKNSHLDSVGEGEGEGEGIEHIHLHHV